MTKLILIVICLGLLRISGAAQGIYFNNTYPYKKTANFGQSVVVVHDSSYMVAGFNNIPSPGAGDYVFLRKINDKGDTQYVQSFPIRTNHTSFINCGANSIFKNNIGYKLMGLNDHYDTAFNEDYAKFFMCDVDSIGDTLNYKEYGWDTLLVSSISNAMRTRDGGYAMPGWEFAPNSSGVENMFILKIDSLGNEKFKTIIPGGFIAAFSVTEAKDKGLVLIGISTGYPYSTGPTTMHIVKVDSTGKYQWTKDWGTGSAANVGWDIQGTKEGGFLALGYKTVYVVNSSVKLFKPWLLQLDSAGNVKWEHLYGDTMFEQSNGNDYMRLIPTGDSNYIIMGNLGYYHRYKDYYTFLLKVKPNGDSLWWRYIPRGQQADEMRDIKQTPDKGFILCGYQYNSSKKPDIWLVKTDSLGCDVGGCTSTSVEELTINNELLKIYPNPNEGVFTVNYSVPLNTKTTLLSITSVVGKEVKAYKLPVYNKKFDIGNIGLPQGVYICQLYADGQLKGTTRIVIVK